MAGNLWGADVAQLRTLAQQFGKTSETLLQQSTTLTSAINGNTAWKGADGARFTSEWNGSHRALIQKTALALKEESKRLMTHAEQQEKASNAAAGSGGGPGALGLRRREAARNNPWGPDWLAGPDSPFRGGWDIYNLSRRFPTSVRIVRHRRDAAQVRGLVTSWTPAPGERSRTQTSSASSSTSRTSCSRDAGMRPSTSPKAPKHFGPSTVSARALAVLGVGLDGLDAVNAANDGEYSSAAYSGTKALIGAGSFLPPPAGTACMVASAGLAIYDNVPIVHDSVNYVGGQIADGAGAVADSVSDGASAVADTVSDGAEAVGDFFGF